MSQLTGAGTSATIEGSFGNAGLVTSPTQDWIPMVARRDSGRALGACLGMIWAYIPAVFAVLVTGRIVFMLMVLGGAGAGAAYGWWDDRRIIRRIVDQWITLASPAPDSPR